MTRHFRTLIQQRPAVLLIFILVCSMLTAGTEQTTSTQRQAAKSARISSPTAGAITGRVISADGRPLAQVMVNVYPVPLVNASAANRRVIFTDRDGNFRALDLPSGVYTVTASLRGYFSEIAASEPGLRNYYRPGDTVTITMKKGGVITGQVTNEYGQPVVGQSVSATRVRDFGQRATLAFGGGRETDDRGIYRIYGLPPGVYLVLANPGTSGASFVGQTPTYFPSSTRTTAQEIILHDGEEVSEINIHLRGERGHTVSGTIVNATGVTSAPNQFFVSLAGGGFSRNTAVGVSPNGFVMYGVPDGEYDVQARHSLEGWPTEMSPPRRITVKGADVTDVQLSLAPIASIAGRLVLASARGAQRQTACETPRPFLPPETVIITRRDDQQNPNPLFALEAAPNDQGDFTIRNLEPTRYRVMTQLPSENWYVRAITLPAAARGRTPIDAARDGLALKPGDHVKDLTVTIADGAASVRGQVVRAREGASLPARLRVHLVPAERERANDALRYSQTETRGDGSFTVTNLAPGRYWLIAYPIPPEESTTTTARAIAWESTERAKLRREAEAAKIEIELQLCQRVSDYVLRYTARQ